MATEAEERALARGRIRAIAQIRALASPVRQDILDVVDTLGPCSVATVAHTLGRRPDGLYYHIARLRRVGLIAITEEPGANGRATARLRVRSSAPALVYDPSDARNRDAVLLVVAGMLRNALRGFRRAFRPEHAVVSGLGRNLWAGRRQAVLDTASLEEVNMLVRRILRILHSRRPREAKGGSLHEFTFVLAVSASRGAKCREGGTRVDAR
jgi:DNA-binding transcriptional ArsR family regulator